MFERFDLLIGKEKRINLSTKTIVIVGIGGVGGYVVESLARCGIGHLVLIDFDVVDITNKNRQLVALDSTIGMKKVDVLKKRILDINSNCQVDTLDIYLNKDNIEDILNKYDIDYLVDACDAIKTKQAIIDKCLKDNIPFVCSLGTGKRLDPSMLEITDLRKTEYDPLARLLRKYVKDNNIKAKITVLYSREHPLKIQSNKVASCSFVPSSAGLLITSYVIKDIIK